MRGVRSLTRNKLCSLWNAGWGWRNSSAWRVDECHASVAVRIKRQAIKESVRDKTRERQDGASHDKHRRRYAPDTTDSNYAVKLPQHRLCALPCCRQTIISHQDTTGLLRTCCSLQSVILQYINTKQNNAYINATRNLIKRTTQHNTFHFIHPWLLWQYTATVST